MNLDVPVNTYAFIYLPTQNVNKVTENGKRIKYKIEKTEGQRIVLKLGSGAYNFMIEQ